VQSITVKGDDMRKATRTVLIATALRVAATAILSGVAGTGIADPDRVTFVENVRCNAGACQVQHKTIPVNETVRAKDADSADFCVEYTRRLTGFKTFPSLDPAIAIQLPQFQEGEKRYFRCAPALVSAR
jgi:hypothetical protein